MKASDLFIKALENEGVEFIFGVPGEENLDLIESIRTSSIKFIVTRHEQSAGFMAATLGRLTGKTGVCLATLGPGATNLMTSAAYAQLGAMPLLMITGQKPIKSGHQGKFQMVNVVEMMRGITKSSCQIVDCYHIPHLIREAFRLAERERPGAVHLELPEDIAKEEACDCPIFTVGSVMRSHAGETVLRETANVIMAAQKPLLLIGAGANRKRTSITLKRFIHKTQIPFFNTQMGKGVIDERDDLFLGTAALSENDYVHCAIRYADLIINVGHDIVEKPPFLMKHGQGAKVIHINFFPAEIDSVYFPELEVVGDISQSLHRLTDLCLKQDHWQLDFYHEVKRLIACHIAQGSEDARFPITPQRIVSEVRDAMPDDGMLALDNGMYKIWFARNYKAHRPNTVLLDNALATMGAGLPSAIAAKIIYPERKVLAICGDGGFMMSAHEVETASRLKLNLVVLILLDNAYGMIKWKQQNMHFADYALDFSNPDFVKFAESFSAKGYRINDVSQLGETLRQCLDAPGLHLLEVPVDYTDNKDLGDKLKTQTDKLVKSLPRSH